MKKSILSMAIGVAVMHSACNTVEGAGKGIQSAGEAVEEVAN
jgi:predicted small secreted protein